MIANGQEYQTTLERIAWFQNQAAQIRKTERDQVNYKASISGFLAEIDRMQFEVREYLSFLPKEIVGQPKRNKPNWSNLVWGTYAK